MCVCVCVCVQLQYMYYLLMYSKSFYFFIIIVYIYTDLTKAFEQCSSKPLPKSMIAKKMYDIKGWLAPHSMDLHQHVQPHCFKFANNEKNEAVMFYRKWSGERWTGPVRLLKVCIFIRQ